MYERYKIEINISCFLVACYMSNMIHEYDWLKFLGFNTYLSLIMIIIPLLSLVGWGTIFRFHRYTKFLLPLIFLLFGMLLTTFFHFHFDKNISTVNKQNVNLRGVVVSDISYKNGKNTFLFLSDETSLTSSTSIKHYVLVNDSNLTNVEHGDHINIRGFIKKPEKFKLENSETSFNYPDYLRNKNVSHILTSQKILVVDKGQSLKKFLYRLRNKFLSNIKNVISEPESSLAGGVLLGDQSGLGDKLESDFRDAGLSHIIVLSGFNITIIAAMVALLLNRFSRRTKFIYSVLFLLIFCTTVGWSATVMRSFIMTLIMCVGELTRRDYDMWRALFVSAFLMVLFNPFSINYDTSFQLSFLATVSLATFGDWMKNKLFFITEKFAMRETLSSTLSAQILTVPYIAINMRNISLISPVTNLLVLPFIPYAMLAAFLVGIVGFISELISYIFSVPTHAILHYIISVVEYANFIPFNSLKF